MNRRALIIANPGEFGAENYCEGVNKDVINYKNFLMSNLGGCWYDNEITVLRKPDVQEVKRAIEKLKDIDYTMIIFCGHGFVYEDDTVLELKNGMYMKAVDLKSGSRKRTIILDCCRVIANTLEESVIYESFAKHTSRMDSLKNTRAYFDAIICECSNGIVVAYGCDLDETAGDDERLGGYYSYSLLKGAKQWANTASPYGRSCLSISAAHERAKVLTNIKSGGEQNPQIEKPRTQPYFPFAVKIN